MGVPNFPGGVVLGTAAADPGSGVQGQMYLYTPTGRIRIKKDATTWVDVNDTPQRPDFWRIWAHSYFQYAFGTVDQSGRADSIFRAIMDVEFSNWQNWAVNGACSIKDGNSQGGYTTVFQNCRPPQRGGPYSHDGGASLVALGINDIGTLGQSTAWKDAWIHSMRGIIARLRCSVVFENDFSVGTRTTYGAGFTSIATGDWGSGPQGAATIHWATSLTNATITLNIPADYKGETIVICMGGQAGVSGGTVTFSGSAGVTGTMSNSNIVPTGGGTHTPVVRRITNLTSANASQTIIMTGTALDAGGALQFDWWGLESLSPPAILVCNIAKLPAAGYTTHYAGWSGTEASRDADVNTWNTALDSLVAEFDGMVQIADIDAALAKDPLMFFDNLHPNEVGAGKIVDAIEVARKKLVPPAAVTSQTASWNPPSPRAGGQMRIRAGGFFYTSDPGYDGANYVPVSGDQFWIPFYISGGRERYRQLACEVATAGSVNGAIRWGIYDDPAKKGYPNRLYNELTGPFTVSFAAGPKVSTLDGISWPLEPGIYWISFKVTTVGTGIQYRGLGGPVDHMTNVGSTTGALGTSQPSGYKLSGQGTGALSSTAPATGLVAVDNCPYVGMLLAA